MSILLSAVSKTTSISVDLKKNSIAKSSIEFSSAGSELRKCKYNISSVVVKMLVVKRMKFELTLCIYFKRVAVHGHCLSPYR